MTSTFRPPYWIRHIKFRDTENGLIFSDPENPFIYLLADRWSRTNPNFAQTQTSNKPKLRTNLNFEQTQTSNKPKSFWR